MDIVSNDAMLLDGKFKSTYTDTYYVLPNYEEKEWIKGEGLVIVEDGMIKGYGVNLKESFTPNSIIGIPSDIKTTWYLSL